MKPYRNAALAVMLALIVAGLTGCNLMEAARQSDPNRSDKPVPFSDPWKAERKALKARKDRAANPPTKAQESAAMEEWANWWATEHGWGMDPPTELEAFHQHEEAQLAETLLRQAEAEAKAGPKLP